MKQIFTSAILTLYGYRIQVFVYDVGKPQAAVWVAVNNKLIVFKSYKQCALCFGWGDNNISKLILQQRAKIGDVVYYKDRVLYLLGSFNHLHLRYEEKR